MGLLSLAVLGLLAQGIAPAPILLAGAPPADDLSGINRRDARAPDGAAILLSKTVGTVAGECATTDAITAPPNAPVTYCYKITNTGTVTLTQHTLVDDKLGPISVTLPPAGPGQTAFVTKTTTLTQTTTNVGTWVASDGTNTAFSSDSALVTVVPPSIAFTKTVGLNPNACATSQRVIVQPDTQVTYCYKVTNTGLFTLTMHSLTDSRLGALLSGVSHELAPGASYWLTRTVAIAQTTVNTATWTAADAYSNTVQAGGVATVTIYTVPPQAQIRLPDMDAIITRKGALTISGIGWSEGVTPPYLVDTPLLSTQRVGPRMYYVGWTAVSGAQNYVLQEAKKPDFSDQTSTVLPSSAANLLISKGTGEDGTYYYRVYATRYGSNPSRFSNVKSVVVPWNVSALNGLTFEQPAVIANGVPVTVQVRVGPVGGAFGDWQPAIVTATAWGGVDWAYGWSLPEAQNTRYAIQARAFDMSGNIGPIDAVTVTLNNKVYLTYLPIVLRRWPPIPYAPTLALSSPPDANGNYTFVWTYSGSTPVLNYTLQEATDADFTTNVNHYYPGLNATYTIVNKQPGVYYYRVWGNNTYGAGEISNVVMVTVYPGAPTLNSIDNPSRLAAYTVSWSAGRGAAAYVLQEATTADFASPTVVTTTSQLFYNVTGKSNGTYYYRAQSVGGGLTSGWSNVVSTTVAVTVGFFDDFSTNKGWYTGTYYKAGIRCDPNKGCFKAEIKNGEYVVKIPDPTNWGDNEYGFVALQAPYSLGTTANYTIEVRSRIVRPEGVSWDLINEGAGLVLAARPMKDNNYNNSLITAEYNFKGEWGLTNYKPVYIPWDSYLSPANGYVEPLIPMATSTAVKAGYDRWNTITVRVQDSLKVTVYINGVKVGSYQDRWLTDKKNIGLVLSGWDKLPLEVHFDNFSVTPFP